ncbi:GNAT family N-acetyltransferase, partial [Corynebacterium aurimucosum]
MAVKSIEDMWAPFKLTVRVGELSLRVLRDSDIAAIHGVSAAEIFGEPLPGYTFPWLKEKPDPSFRWAHRAQMSPEEWSLDFGVHLDGEVIGSVDLRAQNFPDNHEVVTGSWIYHRYQGRGIGTQIRHAVAVFCFDYLGAH